MNYAWLQIAVKSVRNVKTLKMNALYGAELAVMAFVFAWNAFSTSHQLIVCVRVSIVNRLRNGIDLSDLLIFTVKSNQTIFWPQKVCTSF